LDDCQSLSQTLRTENARLKDQILALQSQNRDYADRAVDDLRRLAVREQAIERLERSVQAYQDERDHLEEAYGQLTASLGRPTNSGDPTRGQSSLDGGPRAGSRPAPSEAPPSKGITAREDEEPER
jgi:hypothetical protein